MRLSEPSVSVLFVCLGNICRSPLAEGVFRTLVEKEGLADRFVIDSAGTSGWHDAEPPDPRATAVARRHGVELAGTSRKVKGADLRRFHHIIAMDAENVRELRKLAARAAPDADIRLLREYDSRADGDRDVPDPYFGGEAGFENVHDIVERSCRALLADLREQYGL
jgi:protein-tyrosine phosphatase